MNINLIRKKTNFFQQIRFCIFRYFCKTMSSISHPIVVLIEYLLIGYNVERLTSLIWPFRYIFWISTKRFIWFKASFAFVATFSEIVLCFLVRNVVNFPKIINAKNCKQFSVYFYIRICILWKFCCISSA